MAEDDDLKDEGTSIPAKMVLGKGWDDCTVADEDDTNEEEESSSSSSASDAPTLVPSPFNTISEKMKEANQEQKNAMNISQEVIASLSLTIDEVKTMAENRYEKIEHAIDEASDVITVTFNRKAE